MPSFSKPYYQELIHLAYHQSGGNLQPTEEASLMKALEYFKPRYMKLSYLEKLGFKNANYTYSIPKAYRHNLKYSKGYILGSLWDDNATAMGDGKLIIHPSLTD